MERKIRNILVDGHLSFEEEQAARTYRKYEMFYKQKYNNSWRNHIGDATHVIENARIYTDQQYQNNNAKHYKQAAPVFAYDPTSRCIPEEYKVGEEDEPFLLFDSRPMEDGMLIFYILTNLSF
ncbi:hypothetical protein Trydic_g17829 [Trypoxylus dichotomus]